MRVQMELDHGKAIKIEFPETMDMGAIRGYLKEIVKAVYGKDARYYCGVEVNGIKAYFFETDPEYIPPECTILIKEMKIIQVIN